MSNFSTSNRGSGFGDFFRYHGIFAPGIRLFRAITFSAKAAWISVAFVVPLVLLLSWSWVQGQERLAHLHLQQRGTAYIEKTIGLLHAALDRRHAVATGGNSNSTTPAVQQAWQALQSAHQSHGEALEVSEAYAQLKQQHDALINAPASGAEAQMEQHTAYIDSIVGLLNQATNGSQLVLNPALDVNSVVWIASVRGPQQTASLSALRDWGMLALQQNGVPPQLQDTLIQHQTRVLYIDEAIEAAYDHGIRTFPEIDRQLDMKGTDEQRETFLATLETSLIHSLTPGVTAATFAQQADAAIASNNRLMQQLFQRLKQRLAEQEADAKSQLAWQFGIAIVFVLLAGYLMHSFYKVMRGGLQEVAGHLSAINNGNLTTAPKPWGADEFADLMLTLRAMQQTLRRVVGVVLEGTANVEQASREIASASDDLSKRTESNAASLEETAASMEQISTAIHHTAETLTATRQIVHDNAEAAQRSGEVIRDVQQTMEDIRKASGKIGEITNVIDSLAFQTNLLALNAAVEAARAGEQGRGFAVVASEVRALASRSAEAANQIKTLIEATVTQVESGHVVVNNATQAIQVVVDNAGRIEQQISTVANTTHEQSAGTEQVVTAVQDLDGSTQQNASLVEETAASAQALAVQAHRLAEEVSFFKIQG